jgi:putative transposase
VYVWADGIYLQARLEDGKQCILVLIGATLQGHKEFIGFTDGARESAQDWRDRLLDLKRRGLDARPQLAIGCGLKIGWLGDRLKPISEFHAKNQFWQLVA